MSDTFQQQVDKAQGVLEGLWLKHAEPDAQIQLKSLVFAACMQYACS